MARLLGVMVGYDAEDRMTGAVHQRDIDSYVDQLDPTALKGARLGVLHDGFADDIRTPRR